MSKFYVLNNLNDSDLKSITDSLKAKNLAVLPTDTIYGLHGLALSPEVEDAIFKLKNRDRGKGFICLISDLADLKLFKIKLTKLETVFLKQIWPAKVSVILHRDKDSFAFRLPDNAFLQALLKKTGPLISTSANISGQKSAETIAEAEKYLGDSVGLYVNAGKLTASSSTVVDLQDNQLTLIRPGAVNFDSLRQTFEALHQHRIKS